MRSVQFNLIVDLNEANGGQPTSNSNPHLDVGTANPKNLRIAHSIKSESRANQRLDLATDLSKTLDIVAKLRRKAVRMANAKALKSNSAEIFSRSYINNQAKKCNENIAQYQLSKPNPNPYVVYEERKKQWDQQHPDAKPEQRDAAMTCIARECGV